MKIAIGSDHAGFRLKETLKQWLLDNGHDVTDVGTYSEERTDYPKWGALVGRAVASGDVELGVGVCGSGQGICMAANKVPGVRGGVVRDIEDARIIRQHNNANVACFGERFTTPEIATGALEAFLAADFEGGRHVHRVDMLGELDQTNGRADL